MIKNTFYNLPKAKRDRIFASIKKEFDRVPLDKISINRIIKDAGISRGSFYQYFDDKGDLYDIFADRFSEELHTLCTGTLGKNKGDIFKTMSDLMEITINNTDKTLTQNKLKNLMPGVSTNAKDVIDRVCNNIKEYMPTILNNIDTTKLTVKSTWEIEALLSMLGMIVHRAMLDYFIFQRSIESVTEDFAVKINMLKNGCLKEEYRNK